MYCVYIVTVDGEEVYRTKFLRLAGIECEKLQEQNPELHTVPFKNQGDANVFAETIR